MIEGLLYLAVAILVMVAFGAVVRRLKRIAAPVAARRVHRRHQAAAAQVLERYLRGDTTLDTAAQGLVELYGQAAKSAMWLGVLESPGKATIPPLMPPEFSSDDPRVRQLVNRVAELLRTRAAGSLSSSVRSRVTREFSRSDRDEIELFLMQYTNDNPEPERVHTAILVLGQGGRNEVAYNVWVAMRDYRDVLYTANHDKFKES